MENKKLIFFFILGAPLIYFFIFYKGSFDYISNQQDLFLEHVVKSISISFIVCYFLHRLEKKEQ